MSLKGDSPSDAPGFLHLLVAYNLEMSLMLMNL